MVFDAVEDIVDSLTCERCEEDRDISNMRTVTIPMEQKENIKSTLCSRCREEIQDNFNKRYWYQYISESDYDALVDYLKSIEYTECVHHDSYTAGEIIVHTKYGTSQVVETACEHFGYKIDYFRVYQEGLEQPDKFFECYSDVGPYVEICIIPSSTIEPLPYPIEESAYNELDYINESQKLFD